MPFLKNNNNSDNDDVEIYKRNHRFQLTGLTASQISAWTTTVM